MPSFRNSASLFVGFFILNFFRLASPMELIKNCSQSEKEIYLNMVSVQDVTCKQILANGSSTDEICRCHKFVPAWEADKYSCLWDANSTKELSKEWVLCNMDRFGLPAKCENGFAGIHSCQHIDVVNFVPFSNLTSISPPPSSLGLQEFNTTDFWDCVNKTEKAVLNDSFCFGVASNFCPFCRDMMADKKCERAVDYFCATEDKAAEADIILNDIWGWTHPLTHVDYAIVGTSKSIEFVEIPASGTPSIIGFLRRDSFPNYWTDIKVDQNYAFIVTESHTGLEVVDLMALSQEAINTNLRPIDINPVYHYKEFGTAHNIWINTNTHFAYVVGTSKYEACHSGIHFVNISEPTSPVFAGCLDSLDGYVHDVECITYNTKMPDANFHGREICFCSYSDYPILENFTGLVIIDVTDKANAIEISRGTWNHSFFSHQGSLTEDGRYFLIGDELDEHIGIMLTKTFVFDVSNLANPIWHSTVEPGFSGIGHNMYVHGSLVYQSNYEDGLRILQPRETSNGSLYEEVGYFDVYPQGDNNGWEGSWSNYLFRESGRVAVTDQTGGLFILKPHPNLLPIDQCLLDPCQNEGICTSIHDSYYCSCHADFAGEHCEINLCTPSQRDNFITIVSEQNAACGEIFIEESEKSNVEACTCYKLLSAREAEKFNCFWSANSSMEISKEWLHCNIDRLGLPATCENGFAGIHSCRNIDILGSVPFSDLTSVSPSPPGLGLQVFNTMDFSECSNKTKEAFLNDTFCFEVAGNFCPFCRDMMDTGDWACEDAMEYFCGPENITVNEEIIINDVWGWTHPSSRVDYAIVGTSKSIEFVEISASGQSSIIGFLPRHAVPNAWADMKVDQNHAFIVTESLTGLEVVDLMALVTEASDMNLRPIEITPVYHYTDFGSAHNIWINTDTHFAYVVGTSPYEACHSGIHFVDISNPKLPVFAGCLDSLDGYVHDVECINYDAKMPDTNFYGREICFCSYSDYPIDYNFTGLVIIDVTDKANVIELGRGSWNHSVFSHQGTLTEDGRYFLIGDEVDEQHHMMLTRTFIFDVSDLSNPMWTSTIQPGFSATGHNMYTHGSLIYQSNYEDGLRVLWPRETADGPSYEEIGHFDVYPQDNSNGYHGSWSNYLFRESGIAVVTGITEGLFILKPHPILLPGNIERRATPANCSNGYAGIYPCDGIDFLGLLPYSHLSLIPVEPSSLGLAIFATTNSTECFEKTKDAFSNNNFCYGDAKNFCPWCRESNLLSKGDFWCGHAIEYFCRPEGDLHPTFDKYIFNDVWGWTHPSTHVDYAIVGTSKSIEFVEISASGTPSVIGSLHRPSFPSIWADIKVDQNHAFIVTESLTGLQVVDLMALAEEASDMNAHLPINVIPVYNYTEFGSAHNIFINTDSHFAYAVGTSEYGPCHGGMHFVNIANPTMPVFSGCLDSLDGYVHDVECVTYDAKMPDANYHGHEICFASYYDHPRFENFTGLVIIDVTDKANTHEISRGTWDFSRYSHQGSLTEDGRYFIIGDEVDESHHMMLTRTFVFDVSDLKNPVWTTTIQPGLGATGHNMYVHGTLLYQSNYADGLRILKPRDTSNGPVYEEIGHFDVYPERDGYGYFGTWSNYLFRKSGMVVVTGTEEGLFILKPHPDLLPMQPIKPCASEPCLNGGICTNEFDFTGQFDDSYHCICTSQYTGPTCSCEWTSENCNCANGTSCPPDFICELKDYDVCVSSVPTSISTSPTSKISPTTIDISRGYRKYVSIFSEVNGILSFLSIVMLLSMLR